MHEHTMIASRRYVKNFLAFFGCTDAKGATSPPRLTFKSALLHEVENAEMPRKMFPVHNKASMNSSGRTIKNLFFAESTAIKKNMVSTKIAEKAANTRYLQGELSVNPANISVLALY